MGVIEVNPAQVAKAAKAISVASRNIDAGLEELTAHATILRRSWSGDAQSAFDAAQERFDGNMRERTGLVMAVSDLLGELATQYSDADLAGQRVLGGS
ncbi:MULTISPECIES: WXG100 family type VII secretion target [unclassified Microbacterium]|uniref:WXG100 family type VII secretion target n=1 Tax=unclassified Microbacterium TaxID=2609290 RepID=UPI0034658825